LPTPDAPHTTATVQARFFPHVNASCRVADLGATELTSSIHSGQTAGHRGQDHPDGHAPAVCPTAGAPRLGRMALPDPSTPFGAAVRDRLSTDKIIWLTTVGADGTPQPNPVWFLFDGETILTYNRPAAHRLNHIQSRPRVSLNLNQRDGDVMVLVGHAERIDDVPPPNETRTTWPNTRWTWAGSAATRTSSPPATRCRCVSRLTRSAVSDTHQ